MPLYVPQSGGASAPPSKTVLEPEVSLSQTYETLTQKTTQITDIEGEPWLTQYYHQLLVNGESPQPLDGGLGSNLQQYVKITDFLVSVTEDLAFTQDIQAQAGELIGNALIYPDTVHPHVGDMFVGYIEAGRQGIFTLTQVEALSYYKKSAYRVTYRLYAEANIGYLSQLDSKVTQHRYFDSRRLKAGFSPIVEVQVANQERHYFKDLRRLMDRLYLDYYDKRLGTFIVGTGSEEHYDPWVVSFFNAVIGQKLRGTYPAPTEYDIGLDLEAMDHPHLWSALFMHDVALLETMPRHYGLTPAHDFAPVGTYQTVGNTGIDFVWMPLEGEPDEGLSPYLYGHALYTGADTMTTAESAVYESVSGQGASNLGLSVLIDDAFQSDGIEGLRKAVLAIALLRFKLVGV